MENMSSTISSEADGEDDSGRHSEDVENLRKLLMSGGVDIRVESIDFFAGSSSGDNYMSVVKRVLVKGRDQAENGNCPWFQSCAYSILFCVFSILSMYVPCCSKKCKVKNISFIKSSYVHSQDMRALNYTIFSVWPWQCFFFYDFLLIFFCSMFLFWSVTSWCIRCGFVYVLRTLVWSFRVWFGFVYQYYV